MENEEAPLMGNKSINNHQDADHKEINCCSKNVAVIVLVLIIVKISLIIELFRLWTIHGNENFDDLYFWVYLVLVITIAVVAVLIVLLIFEPHDI